MEHVNVHNHCNIDVHSFKLLEGYNLLRHLCGICDTARGCTTSHSLVDRYGQVLAGTIVRKGHLVTTIHHRSSLPLECI